MSAAVETMAKSTARRKPHTFGTYTSAKNIPARERRLVFAAYLKINKYKGTSEYMFDVHGLRISPTLVKSVIALGQPPKPAVENVVAISEAPEQSTMILADAVPSIEMLNEANAISVLAIQLKMSKDAYVKNYGRSHVSVIEYMHANA